MNSWKTLSRRTILHRPPFLSVELHAVQTSRALSIPDWTWVITPDYVNVFAQTTDGLILCFRQHKYAVAGLSLAPVGGYIEPGESPETAARRELREETGYEGTQWISLGQYVVDANRGAGMAHFFLALDVRLTATPLCDDLEEQELLLLSRSQTSRALLAGEFKALPWAALMALGLHCLDRNGSQSQSTPIL